MRLPFALAGTLAAIAACSSTPSELAGSSASATTVFGKCQVPAEVSTRGGGSMRDPTVLLVPVFWGPNVTSTTAAATASFYDILTYSATPYLSWLRSEYGAPAAAAQPVVTIAPAGYTGSAQTVTDAQIRGELTRQFGPGGALTYHEDAIYSVLLPGSVTAIDANGVAQCTTWCGYHSQFQSTYGYVHYTIIPDPSPTTCKPALCSRVSVSESHEIAETLTDPDGSSGWRDRSQPSTCGGGEIGDLCTDMLTTLVDPWQNSVEVQKLWSNLAQDCVTGDTMPTIASMSPSSGPNTGGTVVTITGARFAPGAATTFMFGDAQGVNAYCSSTTSCTVTTPKYDLLSKTGAKVVVTATSNGVTSTLDPSRTSPDYFQYTCNPLTPAEACGANGCGTANDGCGDTIACPVTCGVNQYCDNTLHACEAVPLCPGGCPSGYRCEAPNGPPGVCVKGLICPVGTKYCNGKCIPFGAGCP